MEALERLQQQREGLMQKVEVDMPRDGKGQPITPPETSMWTAIDGNLILVVAPEDGALPMLEAIRLADYQSSKKAPATKTEVAVEAIKVQPEVELKRMEIVMGALGSPQSGNPEVSRGGQDHSCGSNVCKYGEAWGQPQQNSPHLLRAGGG